MKKKILQMLTRRGIVVAIIVIIGSILFYNFTLKEKKPSYKLETVSMGSVVKEVSETGMVKAQDDINLSFRNSGKIASISVKVGDEVKAGQELAKLDTSDLAIQLSQARASLDVSQARKSDAQVSLQAARQSLDDVKASAKESLDSAYNDAEMVLQEAYSKISGAYSIAYEIQQTYFSTYQGDGGAVIDAKTSIKSAFEGSKTYIDEVNKDTSNQNNIDTALSKIKNYLATTRDAIDSIRAVVSNSAYRSTISTTDKANLDAQKTAIITVYNSLIGYQQAIATVKITNSKNINTAQASVSSLENQLAPDSNGGLYLSQVEESQTKMSLLANQMEDAVLKSPVSGKITKIEKKAGETAGLNETVISMLSSGPFEIKVDIYEEDIVGVEVGNVVKIDLVAFPDETITGKVIAIDPAEKVVDGVVYYETTIAFDEIKKGLRSGMTADIAIEVNKKENVLMISKGVIEKNNGERSVKVYAKGKAEKRIITIGVEGNDYVEVLSGLKQGEQIITSEKI